MNNIEQALMEDIRESQSRTNRLRKQNAVALSEVTKVNGDRPQADHIRNDHFLVTFGPGDAGHPKNWSKGAKWAATLALSAQGFNRIMISTVRRN
jgi:hypothetical protein